MGTYLAPNLRELMPWIKIIANLREPISRRISWYVFNEDKFQKGCLHNNTLTYCLFNDSNRKYGTFLISFSAYVTCANQGQSLNGPFVSSQGLDFLMQDIQ